MMRVLLAVGAILVLVLSLIPLGCDLEPGTIGVPIEVTNADQVGAIAFNLIYDASVLEAQEVIAKKLAKGASAGYSTNTPGTLVVLVENAPDLNGSGTLVEARFKVLNAEGSTTFKIEVAEALSLETREPVETSVLDGSYSGPQNSVQPPTIVFGQ